MTEVLVHVERAERHDDGADTLRSLLRWVQEDETLTGDVRARITAGEAVAETMGSGFELLQFAVGNGISVAALVLSVVQWRTSLRRSPDVTLRRGTTEVRIDGELARDPEGLRRVVEALDHSEAPGDGGAA
ncbi:MULTISPECIES: effector-associated constant component EACC1 [Streptomyces]|uniref:Uncharacterized protein n=1 Tax=Streptomyces xanthochromogenes TaxID=67384 RepID=A0ABQ3AFU7_9ACTN|nr:hypothetical protein [Streptomyces xanthochromogenes]MYV94732.1 hypothetical protein [Streptomyces sp. SID1034]GGY47192.1 hypothetical protein GCM10010326_46560 [Streptomyces xanthochromogenes]